MCNEQLVTAKCLSWVKGSDAGVALLEARYNPKCGASGRRYERTGFFRVSSGFPPTSSFSYQSRCATNRKVAGSIPGGVIGIFLPHNPSDLTMAFRSTQPLTEMRTRSISWW